MIGSVSENEKFDAKVDSSAGPEACWPWQAYRNRHGYGRLKIIGKSMYAHRFAALRSGKKIEGLCVLHSCDNPSCVNPAHLSTGTRADNKADCVAKGRHWFPVGEGQVTSKLTASLVREIRRLFATGRHTKTRIGIAFGVTRTTVYHIVTRKQWSHVL